MEWVLSLCLLYAKHSKSTTQKPSPLGEGGRREPDGRGELALNPRLLHSQRTHPNNCRSKKQHQIRKAIQPCKRAPPHRALTGPPPTQRGRHGYMRAQLHNHEPLATQASFKQLRCRSHQKSRPPLGEGGIR